MILPDTDYMSLALLLKVLYLKPLKHIEYLLFFPFLAGDYQIQGRRTSRGELSLAQSFPSECHLSGIITSKNRSYPHFGWGIYYGTSLGAGKVRSSALVLYYLEYLP